MKLTIVSTPIGNLQDISARALEALQNVDYILCEDTRRAQKLKFHFSLAPKLVSFHEHNEKTRIPKILALMKRGKTFALISDAGSPLISDPGFLLIRELIREKIPFTYVPGPSALIASLVLSGLPAQPFSFHGFLPKASAARKAALENLAALQNQTLVLFESPERILGLLREIGEFLGNRPAAICRELTKLHEEVLRGTISELIAQLTQRKLRGEFTVIIAPGETEPVVMDDEEILKRFTQLQKEGGSRKEILKKLSKESGRSRNELYQLLFTKH